MVKITLNTSTGAKSVAFRLDSIRFNALVLICRTLYKYICGYITYMVSSISRTELISDPETLTMYLASVMAPDGNANHL